VTLFPIFQKAENITCQFCIVHSCRKWRQQVLHTGLRPPWSNMGPRRKGEGALRKRSSHAAKPQQMPPREALNVASFLKWGSSAKGW